MPAFRFTSILAIVLICSSVYAQIDITGTVTPNFYEINDQVPFDELLTPSQMAWSEGLYNSLVNENSARTDSLLASLRLEYYDQSEYRYYAAFHAIRDTEPFRYQNVLSLLDSFPLTKSDPRLVLILSWSHFTQRREFDHDKNLTKFQTDPNFGYLVNYTLGSVYLSERRLRSAEEEFVSGIEKMPGFAGNYLGMSLLHFYRTDYEKSLEYARECLEKDSTNEKARVMKIILGIFLDAHANDPAADIGWLKQADPDNQEYYYLEGLIQYAMGYTVHALDDFYYGFELEGNQDRKSSDPYSFMIKRSFNSRLKMALDYYYDSRAKMSVNERELAAACIINYIIIEWDQFKELTTELVEKSDHPIGELLSLINENDSEKRIALINQFLTKDPSYQPLLMEKLRISLDSQQEAEAVDILGSILEDEPNNEEALLLRSQAYMKISDYHKAYRDLTRMLFIDSLNLEARYYRGISAMKMNYFKDAYSDFDKIHGYIGDQNDILQLLYYTSLQLKDTAQAKQHLNQAINAGFRTVVNMIEQGNWYILEEKYPEAIDWFSSAAARFPEEEKFIFLLGYCQFRNGDYQTAIKNLDRYSKSTNDPEGIYYLGKSLVAVGDPKGEEYIALAYSMGFSVN